VNPLWIVGGLVVAVGYLLDKKDTRSAPTGTTSVDVEPRAFISFDYDHNLTEKNLFTGQLRKNSPTPFSAKDWSSKEPLPPAKWESLIYEKIGRCHVVFVLVSPTCHRASGVEKEIAMAAAQSVPLIGVYVASADESTPLPKGLSRERVYRWKWRVLAQAVARMMSEGRNLASKS
jgi:hypothetical protein